MGRSTPAIAVGGAALGGAMGARVALRALRALPGAAALDRTNFRGRTVTLAAGPALAAGAAGAAAAGAALSGSPRVAAAAVLAGLGSGLVGAYDDVVGARPEQRAAKGFRGHLAALRAGRVTSGLVKVVGVGAAGLGAAALLGRGRGAARIGDVLLSAGVIAGTANLINLLDLRPGRAAKVGLLLGAPIALAGQAGAAVAAGQAGAAVAAAAAGAAAGLLPADLDERVMLGDAGANALGALLGVALVERTGRVGKAALLAGILALTAASEKVSFTTVIGRTPVLRELDALGRRAG